jgi:hypothetical protein
MIIKDLLSPDTSALVCAYVEAKINLCQCENGTVSAPKSFILRQDAISLAIGKSFRDSYFPNHTVNGQLTETILLQTFDEVTFQINSGEKRCIIFVASDEGSNLTVVEGENKHSMLTGEALVINETSTVVPIQNLWSLLISFSLNG